jgi:sugar O-acyltransferase (sialic acid O-acetyltransferase NeuD family)
MLLIGTGGFSKEVTDVILHCKLDQDLVYYNDVDLACTRFLQSYIVLNNEEQVSNYFNRGDKRFVIALGGPSARKRMFRKFTGIGGIPHSIIGCEVLISKIEVSIGEGSVILNGAVVSSSVKIGKGCLIYYSVNVTHDCKIGEFVEIAPGVSVLGGAEIGDLSHIGANAVILPKVKVGSGVIVGAGSVVNKDVPDNCTVVGVPAKIIKWNNITST